MGDFGFPLQKTLAAFKRVQPRCERRMASLYDCFAFTSVPVFTCRQLMRFILSLIMNRWAKEHRPAANSLPAFPFRRDACVPARAVSAVVPPGRLVR